jgi:cytochrome c553
VKIAFLWTVAAALASAQDFSSHVKPVLVANCAPCHNPANPKNRLNFLAANDARDIETRRNLWRNVATQLRNRTMPPGNHKLAEGERLSIANWIETRLRESACTGAGYAGFVAPRRLNRREYRNTVRDLLGLELPITDMFPADESGGAGFDTNGDTLYIPPMMLERYMEAAKSIADRVIVSPPLTRVMLSHELSPVTPPPPPKQLKPTRVLQPGEEVSAKATAFAEGAYNLRVSVGGPPVMPFTLEVLSDGAVVGKMNFPRDAFGGATARVVVAEWGRGEHEVTIRNGTEKVDFYSLTIEQKVAPPTADKRALHYRLLGVEPGETPVQPREAAKEILGRLLPKAYRRPVEQGEVERMLTLFDRSAKRGEPFEESMKYALRAVFVSPRFLFHVADPEPKPGIQPLDGYALASRLSYFLWSTMPDETLWQLASQGRLNDAAVLRQQVERMLNDSRSRAFANAFTGQWLGTQEIGGRAVPLLTELQHFYTPEVAADLREQPALLFHSMLREGASLLDLLDGDYTFMTQRLARYYQIENQIAPLPPQGFHRVQWPDKRRGGVLGLASVLAMSSHYKQASPVLRGAWILDTLLGTPVPPPPPDVPTLEEAAKAAGKKLTVREMLRMHRESTACAACHNLMDPYGLALENFDWMGRWRDSEDDGSKVDATARFASGESVDGAAALRQHLLAKKDDFLRHFTTKTLGFALGRAIQDGDQCTIEALMKKAAVENYSARALVREVVLSVPFRNSQSDASISTTQSETKKKETKRLLGTK